MEKKMGRSSSVKCQLNQTDLPYSEKIIAMPLLPKFKVSQIDMYDGSKDPVDHLENFKVHITLHCFLGKIACRAFPLSLKVTTRGWFGTLKQRSINSFKQLAKQLLMQFMPNRRHRRPTVYLLTVKQKKDKNLKAYLTHFNKEMLTIDDQDKKITLATLLGGIWLCSPFMVELSGKTPTNLREFMDREDDFVNAEDTLQALVDLRKEQNRTERRNGQVDRKPRSNH
ncbi:uncharacterized protein LOC122296802 [Carya illinoinensis]|uniref:uncharacterized protein LOC122296802 n=1 Tax=Carya illinoinensis TaxID=32201 RepID=UPI001C71F5EE|nr:uncharacterized protein LOC122296802 [Carya illinoinensis]